ncbi:hypothetical protein X729_31025 [Mesorhizobium sp. L103C131B0]|nr:hypothetical protein X729_31025 [Mesorhizobium sp. L103C131B0]
MDSHDRDTYDKSFKSWDHLMELVYAQLSGANSLHSLKAGWNANCQHHYHFGSDRLRRSTLSDANGRRPVGVFAETFGLLAANSTGRTRLIDSTPIPLGKACAWPSRTAAFVA